MIWTAVPKLESEPEPPDHPVVALGSPLVAGVTGAYGRLRKASRAGVGAGPRPHRQDPRATQVEGLAGWASRAPEDLPGRPARRRPSFAGGARGDPGRGAGGSHRQHEPPLNPSSPLVRPGRGGPASYLFMSGNTEDFLPSFAGEARRGDQSEAFTTRVAFISLEGSVPAGTTRQPIRTPSACLKSASSRSVVALESPSSTTRTTSSMRWSVRRSMTNSRTSACLRTMSSTCDG